MKRFALLLLLACTAAAAATPDQIQTCSSLSAAAAADSLVGCPKVNVGWGPTLTTDLVRIQQASAGNTQKWVPYNTVVAADKAVRKSSGGWDTFSNITVTPAPAAPAPATIPTITTVAIAWEAPTTNTDNSPLTDLASYNIYQGATAATLAKVGTIAPPALRYSTPNLPPGTYYFAVTAVNSKGIEGAQSGVVSTVLTPPAPKVPGSPTGLKVTVTVTAGP